MLYWRHLPALFLYNEFGHRRFIAPGAVWDIMVGVEVIGTDYELRYNAFVRYRMDYLFGGTAALASVIAQANAAAKAENDVKEQLALFQSGKRKKRSRLVFNPHIYIYHIVTNSSTWQIEAPSSCYNYLSTFK